MSAANTMAARLARRPLVVAVVALVVLIGFVVVFHRVAREDAGAARSDVDGPTLLIYNRIPKTGSTTLMQLPYELCKTLGYNVVMLNSSKTLSPKDEVRLVRNATTWTERLPAIFHGHFAFVDFDKLSAFTDGGRSPKPVYINVVRKPLDRLISYYYFLRYGDDFRSEKIRSRMGDTVTFDECVSRKASFDCDPKKMWLQIPWFCGNFKKCWEPGNRWALEQAKKNLVDKYFLVGITEELEAFVEVLEATLPGFFAGATKIFRESSQFRHIRKTRHKESPSEQTLAKMQDTRIWKLENEFYDFANSHFQWVKGEKSRSTGRSYFHYEKIRP